MFDFVRSLEAKFIMVMQKGIVASPPYQGIDKIVPRDVWIDLLRPDTFLSPVYLVLVETFEENGVRKGFHSWKDRLVLGSSTKHQDRREAIYRTVLVDTWTACRIRITEQQFKHGLSRFEPIWP